MIRVAIIGDSATEVRALSDLLADEEQIEVVPAYPSGDDETAYIHVILTTSAAGARRFRRSGLPVLIVGEGRETDRAFREPIRGWLPATVSATELASAISAIAHNLLVLTGAQATRWLKPSVRDDSEQTTFESLTSRESQVLRMLADGVGNKEIAVQLGISNHTAKFHVAQILAKLGANSRTEAVALGMRRGLVPV